MGNYHVPFWRAVEGVTPSLTLILENAPENKVGRASSELNACGEVGADTPRGNRKRTL
jgi:hypothetical protein